MTDDEALKFMEANTRLCEDFLAGVGVRGLTNSYGAKKVDKLMIVFRMALDKISDSNPPKQRPNTGHVPQTVNIRAEI
jgi:hypothetical protein